MSDNLYTTLNSKEDASYEEIKQSYHKLVREHHPDKTGDNRTTETFRNIESAWKVLGNAMLRKEYDAFLMDCRMGDEINIYDTVRTYELIFDRDEQKYTYDCRCGSKYKFNLNTELIDIDDVIIIPCSECSFCIKVIK